MFKKLSNKHINNLFNYLKQKMKQTFMLLKKIWIILKENPIPSLGVAIGLVTLYFVIKSYQSPPDVKCEIDLIQRPDSVFQVQLYIWNDGGQTAQNIIIWAKFRDVFQWDSSSQKKMSPLYIYPQLNVFAKINPIKVLDEIARVKTVEDHKITIPQLSGSERDENYIIICPNLNKLEYYKSLSQSIYREKFIELKKIEGIKSYTSELLDNIIVFYEGKPQKIVINSIYKLDEIDTTKFVFPNFLETERYRDKAISPDNILPPESNKIKNEDDDSWFLFFR